MWSPLLDIEPHRRVDRATPAPQAAAHRARLPRSSAGRRLLLGLAWCGRGARRGAARGSADARRRPASFPARCASRSRSAPRWRSLTRVDGRCRWSSTRPAWSSVRRTRPLGLPELADVGRAAAGPGNGRRLPPAAARASAALGSATGRGHARSRSIDGEGAAHPRGARIVRLGRPQLLDAKVRAAAAVLARRGARRRLRRRPGPVCPRHRLSASEPVLSGE